MVFSVFDRMMMAEALQLSRKGLYTTEPNPRVGCVLTQGGQIVGRGWHVQAGEGHAEVNALSEAASRAKCATAYVTLEPCSHVGRTPPCAEALIRAGVSRVVAAMQDPNPKVAGKGFTILKEAGIQTQCGLLENESAMVNPGFIKRMKTGIPWVRVKLAMSLDGRTAMASGESQWITGAAARQDVQRLRARSSAIITGSGTVRQDNPSLTVRPGELGDSLHSHAEQITQRQPKRVILAQDANLDDKLSIFNQGGDVILVTSPQAKLSASLLSQPLLQHWVLDQGEDGYLQLEALLHKLAEEECNEVMIEAGATLAGAFVASGLVDELYVYMAPTLMGSHARPLLQLPLEKMNERIGLKLQDIRQVGEDLRLIYTLTGKSPTYSG